eukprot:gene15487-6738_t
MAFKVGHAVCCSYKIYLILSVLVHPVKKAVLDNIKIHCSDVSRGENLFLNYDGCDIVGSQNVVCTSTCLIGHLALSAKETKSEIWSLKELVSNVTVEQKISGHFAIEFQLALDKPSIEKKEVTFRRLNQIEFEKFNLDLHEKFIDFDKLCDINDLTASYNRTLREVLDKHAPEQTKFITLRNKNQGFSLDIRNEKKKRRQLERRWRRSRSAINRELFVQQKEKHDSALQLAGEFMEYFSAKVEKIQVFIEQSVTNSDTDYGYEPFEKLEHMISMTAFRSLPEADVKDLIMKSPATFCDLDPVPTWILGRCQEVVVKIMTQIINKSLQSAAMPEDLKLALLIPLLKKNGLEIEKPNFQPV